MSGGFNHAFDFTVLKWETGGDPRGGYVNHPDDPGGETRWGVSKAAHPDVDIRNLSEAQARAIYREHYWDKVRGDELPPATALAVFDWSVHSNRRKTVVPRVQRLVGARPDGLLGPKTASAICAAAAGPGGDDRLATRIMDLRTRYLVRLMSRGTADPSDDRLRAFELGWVRRLVDLAAEVVRVAGA